MSKKAKTPPTPTEADLRGWVNKDLGMVISFLNMIRNNPHILTALQDIIIQRWKADQELIEQESIEAEHRRGEELHQAEIDLRNGR